MSARGLWLGGAGLAALVALAPACSTSVAGSTSASYDVSTFLATSQPVLALAVDDANVYWVDWSGGVWWCSKTACGDAPTSILAPMQPASLDPSGTGSPSSEIAVVGGWVFWSYEGSFYTCPTSGCPASGATNMTAPRSSSSGPGVQSEWFVYDSTGVYWRPASNPGTIVRWTPGCSGPGCPEDLFAAWGMVSQAFSCIGTGCPCGKNASADCGTGVCDPVAQVCVGCVPSDPAACDSGFSGACASATKSCGACNGDWGSTSTAPCPFSAPTCSGGSCMRCTSNAECTTGGTSCYAGFCGSPCTSDAQCPSGKFCAQTGTQPAVCVPQLPNGTSCGGYTSQTACADGPCVSSQGSQCGYPDGQGACTGHPAVCISGVCGADGACGLANGEACSYGAACRSKVCGSDGKCGLVAGALCATPSSGEANPCRVATCMNGNCGGYPLVTPDSSLPFAAAGGTMFFTDGSGGIDSCPASGCTLATVSAVRKGAGSPSIATGPVVIGADAKSVFFSDPTGFYRCDLPSCTGTEVLLGPSLNVMSGSTDSMPPMVFTSRAFWAPSANETANTAFYGSATDPYGWCSLASCSGGGPATFQPDPALDSRVVGLGESYGTLPFAADDQSVYWASYSLLGFPGSQIFATNSPTP